MPDPTPIPTQAPYSIEVRVNGRLEHEDRMVDPFVTSTTRVPRRMWWRVLLRGLSIETRVSGEPETAEKVMELNPDYIGPPGSRSRRRWDSELGAALSRFADRLPE